MSEVATGALMLGTPAPRHLRDDDPRWDDESMTSLGSVGPWDNRRHGIELSCHVMSCHVMFVEQPRDEHEPLLAVKLTSS